MSIGKRIFEFILMAFVVCFPVHQSLAESPEMHRLKVGFVLPLSGEWAFLGVGIRDGAVLAQQDLKSAGTDLDLVFEDNRGELAPTPALGTKLIDTDKVDAIISIISGVGQILRPLATRAEVINIGICSEPEVADGYFSFINYLTAEQGVEKFLARLKRVYGSKSKIGIFSQGESGFQRIVKELKFRTQKDGHPQITFQENFEKGTTDFRSLLTRDLASKPDLLLILGLSPEIEKIARQARELHIGTPFASIESFGLAADKSAFEGAWFIDSAVPNSTFLARYTKTFGRSATPGVGHVYDSVKMLADAYYRSASRADFAAKFREINNFLGVIGKLKVQPNGVIWSDASVKVIKKGQAILE